jgi:hypothetical protein
MVDDGNLRGRCAFATRFTMSQSVILTCDLHFEPFDLYQLRAHYRSKGINHELSHSYQHPYLNHLSNEAN